MTTLRQIAVAGALLAGVGVALGAYSAHGLTQKLQSLGRQESLHQRLAWFETGVRYHLYHALGCLVVAMAGENLASPAPRRRLAWGGGAFLVGVALFSGSLYAMTFLGDAWRKLGAITPFGGLAFLLGWIAVASALARE